MGFDECGISIRTSYATYVKCETEEPEEPEESGLQTSGGDCGYEIDYKISFEVWFQGLLEYLHLDENGVLEEEFDEVVSEYAFNSFQPIDYSLQDSYCSLR